MNPYYRSLVSTLLHHQFTKNPLLFKPIHHLHQAYQNLKKQNQ
ncbi:protein YvfG [Bacillus altitudinis]